MFILRGSSRKISTNIKSQKHSRCMDFGRDVLRSKRFPWSKMAFLFLKILRESADLPMVERTADLGGSNHAKLEVDMQHATCNMLSAFPTEWAAFSPNPLPESHVESPRKAVMMNIPNHASELQTYLSAKLTIHSSPEIDSKARSSCARMPQCLRSLDYIFGVCVAY